MKQSTTTFEHHVDFVSTYSLAGALLTIGIVVVAAVGAIPLFVA